MSAWSAAAGKPQISYAERLRNAAKAPAAAQQAEPPQQAGPARIVSANVAQQRQDQARRDASLLPPRSSASKSDGPSPTSPAGAAGQSSEASSSKPAPSAPPAVNIWEARKKQLAEKEAEKAKERQALAQAQKKASPPNEKQTKPTPAPPAKSKHAKSGSTGGASATGSKKEQTPKAPVNGASESKKAAKQTAGAAPSAGGSKAPKSTKQEAAQPAASSSGQPKAEAPAKSKGSKLTAQAGSSIPTTKVLKSAEPSTSMASKPASLDPLPSPPATTDSAIEAAMTNPGAAPRAEDDDAWLARIHMLNGGQNMPNFEGGFKLGEAEEDAQAARKAERAVAAAWGAGKHVWQQKAGQEAEPNGAGKVKKPSEPAQKKPKRRGSNATQIKTREPSPPPLADLGSWPSPLDAGKKESKPKSTLAAELTASPQAAAKKNKQWIPITPNITHSAPVHPANTPATGKEKPAQSKMDNFTATPTPAPKEKAKENGRPAHLPPTPRFPPVYYDPLLHQIEFYFSPQNLTGDFFLRQKMDQQGWVDIRTVAGFNRVKNMTTDITLIRDTIMVSPNLDVDTDKMRVRKRYGWEEWLL